MMKCIRCGVEIPGAGANRKWCSECYRIRLREQTKSKTKSGLKKDAAEAMKLGVSYGKYMSMKKVKNA